MRVSIIGLGLGGDGGVSGWGGGFLSRGELLSVIQCTSHFAVRCQSPEVSLKPDKK